MSVFDDIDFWFNPKRKKSAKNKSSSSGFKNKSLKPSISKYQRVHPIDGVKRVANYAPEVMVKITGSGKGIKQVKNHIDYISRNGEIELMNQDGDKLKGKEDLGFLVEEWRSGGIPLEGTKRETFNIVFSMPEGVERKPVYDAVKAFAQKEFEGHQWVMAEHRDEPHPHVHVCVVSMDREGRRLNPRKQDLFNWRVGFAESLREQGIEASASRRVSRFQHRKYEKFAVSQIKEQAQGRFKEGREVTDREMPYIYRMQAQELAFSLNSRQRPINPAEPYIKDINEKIEEAYKEVVQFLMVTGDKETAKNVGRFVKIQTHDKNQRSRSQVAYDKAMDKIRDREKDREMVRKDIER
ncbi:MAG: relaxase/mobilization nuclease domain-containing protein [Pseudomonadota bacterium]